MFPRVQLKMSRHWLILWPGAEKASSHYLNQWLRSLLANICASRPQWLRSHQAFMGSSLHCQGVSGHTLDRQDQWVVVFFREGFLYPPLQRSWKGGILVSPCLSVRPSVCPSVRLWTESCPLCIFKNTHRIHFIFAHLIKQLQKVCRV